MPSLSECSSSLQFDHAWHPSQLALFCGYGTAGMLIRAQASGLEIASRRHGRSTYTSSKFALFWTVSARRKGKLHLDSNGLALVPHARLEDPNGEGFRRNRSLDMGLPLPA